MDSIQTIRVTSDSLRAQPRYKTRYQCSPPLQLAPCSWFPALLIQPLRFFQSDFSNILILSGYAFVWNLSIVHPQDEVQTANAGSLTMHQVSSSSSAIYLPYTQVSAHAGHFFSILPPPTPSTVCPESTLRLSSYHHLSEAFSSCSDLGQKSPNARMVWTTMFLIVFLVDHLY